MSLTTTAPAPTIPPDLLCERAPEAVDEEILSSPLEAPLWLLAGVEQDEGAEPHIRRGID